MTCQNELRAGLEKSLEDKIIFERRGRTEEETTTAIHKTDLRWLEVFYAPGHFMFLHAYNLFIVLNLKNKTITSKHLTEETKLYSERNHSGGGEERRGTHKGYFTLGRGTEEDSIK